MSNCPGVNEDLNRIRLMEIVEFMWMTFSALVGYSTYHGIAILVRRGIIWLRFQRLKRKAETYKAAVRSSRVGLG